MVKTKMSVERDFNFNIPVTLLKGDADEWKIGGVASTEDKDFQGEIVKIDGLDISALAKNGFFNQDHKKGFENILGKVDLAEKRDNPEYGKHLYVEGTLFKTQAASQAAWNIMNELDKSSDERKMQLSVEGKILKREGKDKKTITKAKVENVALTLKPINEKTFATFIKSFEAFEEEINKAKDIKPLIISFLKENPEPTDEQVHEFAEKNKIDEHKFEEQIYKLLSSYIKQEVKKSEEDDNFVTVRLSKSTAEKLIEYTDSKKSFKEHLMSLCKGMALDEVDKVFLVLRKAKDEIKKKKIDKALTATHSYATQLPQERTDGDVMTQESLDTKKRNSIILGEDEEIKKKNKRDKKLKQILESTAKSFPEIDIKDISKMVFDKYEMRGEDNK